MVNSWFISDLPVALRRFWSLPAANYGFFNSLRVALQGFALCGISVTALASECLILDLTQKLKERWGENCWIEGGECDFEELYRRSEIRLMRSLIRSNSCVALSRSPLSGN